MFGRRRKAAVIEDGTAQPVPNGSEVINTGQEKHTGQKHHHEPIFNHKGHKVTRGIKPDGESGRKWVHPWHFVRICFRSSSTASKMVNLLWPFVPAAIALHFARPDLQLSIFVLNYIAMVPTANLIGFAGQELARKLPKVFGRLAPDKVRILGG